MITPLPGIGRDDIDTAVRSIWRYRAALPAPIETPVSLGEGCTPMVEKTWGALSPHFKLEWFNPTCSFKDRGATVMISFLKRWESTSSKTARATAGPRSPPTVLRQACACVSSRRARLRAEDRQIKAFGAEVQLVPGPREESENEAIRQSEAIFYASHNWHPFFLQGTKSLAYEMWKT
jgi:threonine synthase